MDSVHVIALDPGGRSGYATAYMNIDRLVITGGGVLRQDLMARWLAEKQAIVYNGRYKPFPRAERTFDVIVAESWRPRRKNGSMNWIEGDPLLSVQHVGQIRLIADLSGTPYVEQRPSQKRVFTASMPPKLLDLDRYSNEQHDKDARMHLWGYFFEEYFTGQKSPEDVTQV